MQKAEREAAMKETLRAKVFIARKSAGLTQAAAARKVGISDATWSAIESGNAEVSVARLLEMVLAIDLKAGQQAIRLIQAERD